MNSQCKYYDVDEFRDTFGTAITDEVWSRRRQYIIDGYQSFPVTDEEISIIKERKAAKDKEWKKFNQQ